jgi:lipopolysaccharide export system permease protein
MPILWRFALKHYLQVFWVTVFTFLAVLVVSRFKEVARFGALSADLAQSLRYVVYQFPLILPLAIPLSCLLAAYLFSHKMSRSSELTSWRASGLSLASIFSPLIYASTLLCVINGALVADIAPFCRLETKKLVYKETSANPLLLLQRQKLIKLKHAYVSLKVKEEGKSAKDLFLIAYNEANQRLNLLTARKLVVKGSDLIGTDVAILSHLSHSGGASRENYDPLIIENQASMSTAAPLISEAMKKNLPRLEAGALSARMLWVRWQEGGKAAQGALVELLRRLSLTLSPFSLTLLGVAFGIGVARRPSIRGLLATTVFTLLILTSYLTGKELKFHPLLAGCAFALPHIAIWVGAACRFRQIGRGFL